MTFKSLRCSCRALVVQLGLVMLTHVAVAGDYVVIVNRQNANPVDKPMVVKIYMGNMTSWADGTRVIAFDLPENNAERVDFSNEVMGKAVMHLRAYWAQLTFSGKAMPPRVLATDDEVKRQVRDSPGAIGYIRGTSVDDSVKVIVQ